MKTCCCCHCSSSQRLVSPVRPHIRSLSASHGMLLIALQLTTTNAPTVITTCSPHYMNMCMGQVQIRPLVYSLLPKDQPALLPMPPPTLQLTAPPPTSIQPHPPPLGALQITLCHQHCSVSPPLANYQRPVFALPYQQCHASKPRQACSF